MCSIILLVSYMCSYIMCTMYIHDIEMLIYRYNNTCMNTFSVG